MRQVSAALAFGVDDLALPVLARRATRRVRL